MKIGGKMKKLIVAAVLILMAGSAVAGDTGSFNPTWREIRLANTIVLMERDLSMTVSFPYVVAAKRDNEWGFALFYLGMDILGVWVGSCGEQYAVISGGLIWSIPRIIELQRQINLKDNATYWDKYETNP